MTKAQFVEAVQHKYPQLRDDNHEVTIKARGLKRLIEQAFEEGEKHATENSVSMFDKLFRR